VGDNYHGGVAGVDAAGSADTAGPRKRGKGKRKGGRGGGGSSGSAAIVGDGDVGGSMRAGGAPLLLRIVADALGIERWMSSDKLDARLALQVPNRSQNAAPCSSQIPGAQTHLVGCSGAQMKANSTLHVWTACVVLPITDRQPGRVRAPAVKKRKSR
jgi:hypothetical protein